MNSDSRPDSLDDQDNTNEPPETPAADLDVKETEEKPSTDANAESGSAAIKEENATVTGASISQKDGAEDGPAEDENKETKPILSDESAADGKTKAETKANSPKAEADATASVKTDDVKADRAIESPTATANAISGTPTAHKDIVSTVANIKQETNAGSVVAPAAPVAAAPSTDAKEAMYIKKEPRDEVVDSAIANSNSNEPHDLKLPADIKSEAKFGLDLSDHDHKQDSPPKSAFDALQKFGNGPTPPEAGFQTGKYSEPSPKFPPHDVPLKYSSPGAPLSVVESGTKGDAASSGKLSASASSGGVGTAGPLHDTARFDHQGRAAGPEPPIKYENIESPLSKRPAYAEPLQTLRSPYETTAMMKYNEAMQKYPGVPPPPISSAAAQDLKYVSPADMKYRTPENLSCRSDQPGADFEPARSESSRFDQVRGASSSATAANKYPPIESPIDASARSTPNQDSQGSSNSNLPPQMAHNSSLPSPHPNSSQHANQVPSHLMPGAVPMLMGPVGLQAHHLPPGHPSMMGPSAGSQPPPHQQPPPPTSTSMASKMQSNSSSIQVQPLSLLGAPNPNQILPPSGALHRPHQDLPPPPLHHSAVFGAGILPPLPPHSIGNHQSPSPALSVSRAEQAQAEYRQNTSRMLAECHQNASRMLAVQAECHQNAASPPGAAMLGHPSLPLHLQPGMPMLPPHHSAHLGPPLLPPSMSGSAISLMGGPAPPPLDGRRTPTSAPPPPTSSSSSSAPPGQSSVSQSSSAFSRTSPSVQFSHPSAHRSASPSQPPSSLARGSPLHLSHHSSSSALSAAAVAAAERDRQALLRQQSPHMTPPPPPPTSAASILSSPLNKTSPHPQHQPPKSSDSIEMQQKGLHNDAFALPSAWGNMKGQPPTPANPVDVLSHTPQPRSMAASPPHHLRPGTSPPVIRHPQMPLALPLIGQPGAMPSPMGMHPHNPYSHHLIHPMFAYSHQHNPFNSPYPYHPYPPGFQYMKPPTAAGMEPGVMPPHHPGQVPSRCEEPPSHAADKNTPNSMQHKIKPPTAKTPQGGSTSSTPTASFSSPHAQYASPHAYGDGPIAGKTSHIDALRAHAHSASSSLGGGGGHHSAEPMHVDIEPDPEPEIPSPTHNLQRGPSPEAKPDDTECHRSQSAM